MDRIRHLIYHVLLLRWIILCLAVVTANHDLDDLEMGLPMDGHISVEPLPHELRDEFECTCERSHQQQSSSSSIATSRIFYLIVIHNERTLQDAKYLFRGIRDRRNTILFHIDVKLNFSLYETSILRQEIEACPCGSHVEVASVHNASWSTWSMNLPTLWGMEQAVTKYAGKWDVFINLSGDTLPVYTPDRVARLFSGPLKGINFITSSACETGLLPTPITAFPKHWHKRSHYSYQPASLHYVDEHGIEHVNVTLTTHFGSQWMALLPDWCEYLVRQLQRPDSLPSRFRDYLIATRKLMTDETFIPTLMMHLRPETTPQVDQDFRLANKNNNNKNDDFWEMYAIRYERMDEHGPSSKGWLPSNQHYDVPKSSGIERPKPWGPYFLGVYDLLNIRESGALFIRKVATAIDPNLFHLLPVDHPEDIPPIGWPLEVTLIPKPDWKKRFADLKAKVEKEEKSVSSKPQQATTATLPQPKTNQDEKTNQQEKLPENLVDTKEREEEEKEEKEGEQENEEEEEKTEEEEGEEEEDAEEENPNARDDDMGSVLPVELLPKSENNEEML